MDKGSTILLIEPDEFLADIYGKNLTMNGYNVLLAKTAEKGLSLVKTKKPDLILLEVALRKTDGFEFLLHLKAQKKFKNIPIIIITKLGQKQDIQKAFSLGVSDYIIKTHFSPSELVDKIKRVLAK